MCDKHLARKEPIHSCYVFNHQLGIKNKSKQKIFRCCLHDQQVQLFAIYLSVTERMHLCCRTQRLLKTFSFPIKTVCLRILVELTNHAYSACILINFVLELMRYWPSERCALHEAYTELLYLMDVAEISTRYVKLYMLLVFHFIYNCLTLSWPVS